MNATFPKAHRDSLDTLRLRLHATGWLVMDSQWMRNPRCRNHYIVPAIYLHDDSGAIYFIHISFNHDTGGVPTLVQFYSRENSVLPLELPEVRTVADLDPVPNS